MQKKTTEKEENFNEILRLIREDANKGLNLFYERYSKKIAAVARNYVKSEDLVNVVVNSVLIKIWKVAEKSTVIKNLDAFVFTVSKNCALDQIPKRPCCQLNENIISSKDCLQDVIDTDSFNFLIRKLSDIEKDIITLRYVFGKTFKEIAKILHKPLPTISTMYYRSAESVKNFCKNYEI